MISTLVPAARERVDEDRRRKDSSEQHHEGGQAVEHQHDAEGRLPGAEEVGTDRPLGGERRRRDRRREEERRRQDGQEPLQVRLEAGED